MFDEENEPRKKAEGLPRNLEQMSVHELEYYVTELEAEIFRVKEDIKKKKDVFSQADQFFK